MLVGLASAVAAAMIRGMRVVAGVAGSLVLLAAGCGGSGESQDLQFRIYDAARKVPTEVTTSDIVRQSAEGGPQPTGNAGVFFALTPSGESRFCRLTRALARRGASVKKPQAFAVEFNGEVMTRPTIDYEATPDGICGGPGIQIEGMTLAEADALVEMIRG